jgi:type II secretion system protein H
LLEVLVVLVLVSVITAVAAPAVGTGVQTLRLQSAARHVAAALRMARARAIRQQEVYFVSFDREEGRVTIASGDLDEQRSFDFPQGVRLEKAVLLNASARVETSSPDPVTFFFSPNGAAQALEVRLVNSRGRSLRVVQDAFRRSPRIEQVPPGEN